ncbi:MAG TPA: hypothetical protein VGG28_31195 [Kofleriaceae bacterium]|jgi:hypothetical protein
MRVAVMTALCSSACSLAYTIGPPDPLPARGGIGCTELPAAPIVDVLLAPVASLAALIAAVEIDERARDPDDSLFLASVLVVPAAFLTSAGVGFSRNVRCESAKRELRERGRDPDAPFATALGTARGEELAHDGVLAAERSDCSVAIAIANDLRAMNVPDILDRYLNDVGVVQCMPAR